MVVNPFSRSLTATSIASRVASITRRACSFKFDMMRRVATGKAFSSARYSLRFKLSTRQDSNALTVCTNEKNSVDLLVKPPQTILAFRIREICFFGLKYPRNIQFNLKLFSLIQTCMFRGFYLNGVNNITLTWTKHGWREQTVL